MSMISPGTFIEFECKGKSYKELLEEIYAFENGKISPEERMVCPSPEVVYQMNLEYLGELCKLISDTYNSEVVWKDEEEV